MHVYHVNTITQLEEADTTVVSISVEESFGLRRTVHAPEVAVHFRKVNDIVTWTVANRCSQTIVGGRSVAIMFKVEGVLKIDKAVVQEEARLLDYCKKKCCFSIEFSVVFNCFCFCFVKKNKHIM